MEYDASDPTRFTLSEVEAQVGKRARLILEGEIVGAGESSAGAFARFRPDDRFGFDVVLGLDLDVLQPEEGEAWDSSER